MANNLMRGDIGGRAWSFPVNAAVIVSLGLVIQAWRKTPPTGSRRFMAAGVILATVILCGIALLGRASGPGGRGVLLIVGANLAAFVLAAMAIGSGLAEERRSHFWLGTVFVVLLVLSRFLEYDTSLLLKAAAFAACGVAVLLAGIKYERYLSRTEVARG
jgi:hypothetical protein